MREFFLDERCKIVIPGNSEETINYAAQEWVALAKEAIAQKEFFAVALSGGSTPKAIYQRLSARANQSVDWKKVFLFWSDERCVPPTHPDSNYHMAMEEGGLKTLGIPSSQIFRMHGEDALEKHAEEYEKKIKEILGNSPFDLMMLGMGEDGHTASLFPHTDALKENSCLVKSNFVSQKQTHRMTLTYPCINASKNIRFYVVGAPKAETLTKVLKSPYQPEEYPSQGVGTKTHPAVWIVDEAASAHLS